MIEYHLTPTTLNPAPPQFGFTKFHLTPTTLNPAPRTLVQVHKVPLDLNFVFVCLTFPKNLRTFLSAMATLSQSTPDITLRSLLLFTRDKAVYSCPVANYARGINPTHVQFQALRLMNGQTMWQHKRYLHPRDQYCPLPSLLKSEDSWLHNLYEIDHCTAFGSCSTRHMTPTSWLYNLHSRPMLNHGPAPSLVCNIYAVLPMPITDLVHNFLCSLLLPLQYPSTSLGTSLSFSYPTRSPCEPFFNPSVRFLTQTDLTPFLSQQLCIATETAH